MMRMAIAGVLLLVGTTHVQADQVSDRADRFARSAASMREECGVSIATTYDVRSELAEKRSREPGTGYEYCQNVIDAVRSICSDAEAKPIVAAKLKTVACRFQTQNVDRTQVQRDFDLSIDRGTLTAAFDFRSSNLDSETSIFLRTRLGIIDAKSLKRNQASFAQAVEHLHATCGAKIDVRYDLASELTAERGRNRDHGNGYTFCINVMEGIESRCGGPQKAAIAANLKLVQCKMEHGSSAKMQAQSEKTKVLRFTDLSLVGGTLSVLFDWNTANVSVETADLLERSLPSPRR